ncbi:MAG: O-antigen ligase family protein [Candidatus Marinimicrobia bacterium]|nr:O-antigen ligase family protein [Candidatus Neomarinimicrobiota bacterium]
MTRLLSNILSNSVEAGTPANTDIKFPLGLLLGVEGLFLINLAYNPEVPLTLAMFVGLALFAGIFYNPKFGLYCLFLALLVSPSLYIKTGGVVLRIVDAVFVLLFFSWLVRMALMREQFSVLRTSMDTVLLFLLLLGLISLSHTTAYRDTLLGEIQIIEIVICFYLLVNLIDSPKDAKVFMYIFIIYGLMDSLWIVLDLWIGELGGRHVGLLETTGDDLGNAILFAFALTFYSSNRLGKLLMASATILLAIGMILSLGRGLMIVTIFMVILFSFVYGRKHSKLISLITTGILLGVLGLVMTHFLPDFVSTRYQSIVSGGEGRDFRLVIWYVAIAIFRDNPILGVGLGNGDAAMEAYVSHWLPSTVSLFGLSSPHRALLGVTSPHSEILHFALEMGIIGAAVAMIFYATLLYQAIKLYRLTHGPDEWVGTIMVCMVAGTLVWAIANDIMLAGRGIYIMTLAALIVKMRMIFEAR